MPTTFSRTTIMAALQIIKNTHSHGELESLEIQWGIEGQCRGTSKNDRINDLALIVIRQNPEVMTNKGQCPMDWAILELALAAQPQNSEREKWENLLTQLRFDGFEIKEEVVNTGIISPFWEGEETETRLSLQRMLPNDVPGLNFRETENEIADLLSKHNMHIPSGHLEQAVRAFTRGEWAAANAQLRTFYESYLDQIAERLRCNPTSSSIEKRNFLGNANPPFLLTDLNEWNSNNQKPQYIQGLMSRMHPHGSHAGLSEEDDCAFRLHITLITARLLLRRFDKYPRQP